MSKLTILIFTYNRPHTLMRLLKYYFNQKKKDEYYQIVIADSSSQKFRSHNVYNFISENKIKLINFKKSIAVSRKIYLTLKHVQTKYCVLSADDDFLFVNSLKKCVNFLKKNKDYSSAFGNHYSHTNYEDTLKFRLTLRKISPILYNIDENQPLSRILNFLKLKKKNNPFYAVHKTFDLTYIWKNVSLHAGKNIIFMEYLASFFSLYLGKMKMLPIIYISREPNSILTFDKKSTDRMMNDYNNNYFANILALKFYKKSNTKDFNNLNFFFF